MPKNNLTPTYAKLKFPNTSPASKFTQRKATHMRIKDEIKFLHDKKQQLNYQIYHLHLTLANTWNNTWQYITHTTERKLQNEIQKTYQNLDKKLGKLSQAQTIQLQQRHEFYPKVINNTNILFTQCEMTLLQKGLKYNLHTKQGNWIQNLALKAETAIQKLPSSDREIYRHKVTDRINTLQKNHHPQSNPKNAIHEGKIIRNT